MRVHQRVINRLMKRLRTIAIVVDILRSESPVKLA